MNRHNGFVTCMRCKCVTRVKKTHYSPAPHISTLLYVPREERGPDRWYCRDEVKCDLQRKIQTERDRRLHAALQASDERDMDRQMAFEMRGFMAGD